MSEQKLKPRWKRLRTIIFVILVCLLAVRGFAFVRTFATLRSEFAFLDKFHPTYEVAQYSASIPALGSKDPVALVFGDEIQIYKFEINDSLRAHDAIKDFMSKHQSFVDESPGGGVYVWRVFFDKARNVAVVTNSIGYQLDGTAAEPLVVAVTNNAEHWQFDNSGRWTHVRAGISVPDFR